MAAVLLLLSILVISISCFDSGVSPVEEIQSSLQQSIASLVAEGQNAYKQWQQDYWAKQGIALPGDIYAQKYTGASLKTKMVSADVPGGSSTFYGT